MLKKTLPAILGSMVLILTGVSCFAQENRTNPDEGKQSANDKKAPTLRTIRPEPQAESADILPFARGSIDEETYFRLRDELVATKRGIFDLMSDPQSRLRAVLQIKQQEELIRRFQTNLKASQGNKTVILPQFLFSTWSPLGPDPIPNGQTDPNLIPANELPVSGRVTAIAIDPADVTGNTAYVGAAQGGLYFTQNAGTTWTPLMDSAASLAIGAITIDPTDHNTVFVGTGEGNFSGDSFFGVGLYIVQGATTGSPTLSGPFNSNGTSDVFTGRSITQILVNPGNHNQILVSTSSGFSGMSGDLFSTLPPRGVYLSTNALSGAPTFSLVPIQTVTNRAVTDMPCTRTLAM